MCFPNHHNGCHHSFDGISGSFSLTLWLPACLNTASFSSVRLSPHFGIGLANPDHGRLRKHGCDQSRRCKERCSFSRSVHHSPRLTRSSMDDLDHQHQIPIRSPQPRLFAQETRNQVSSCRPLHRHLPRGGSSRPRRSQDSKKACQVPSSIRA